MLDGFVCVLVVNVIVFEGWCIKDLFEIFQKVGFDVVVIMVVFNDVLFSCYVWGKQKNFEGFVFFVIYEFCFKDSVIDVVKKMVECMEIEFMLGNVVKVKVFGFDVCDWVMLVSMVQVEVVNNEEMLVIVGVFFNCLCDGILFGSDFIVVYGLGKDLLEFDCLVGDFKVDMFYFIYICQGLFVGFINNFGEVVFLSIVNLQCKMVDGCDVLYFLYVGGKIYVNYMYVEYLCDNDCYC